MAAGCVIPNTPISVDLWPDVTLTQSRIFLLTHAHSDHTLGLKSSWSRPIYCSGFTAEYISRTIGVRQELLHPLELNVPHVISLDGHRGVETMTVTLLDASHCPGSVMFVLEGYFGVIVYTGDMRYDRSFRTSESFEILKQYQGRVDVVYLDNTYCGATCVFPSRDKCRDDIVDVINQHQRSDVVIAVRNLGKEDLLSQIAARTNEWISVSSALYKNIESLDLQDSFVVDDNQMCRVRTEPFYCVNGKNTRMWNGNKRTIAVIPSAIFTGRSRVRSSCEDIYVVPYSDHSSFPELLDFVAFLRPKSVVPIVTNNVGASTDDRCDMTCFTELLTPGPAERGVIPESVKAYMRDGFLRSTFCIKTTRKRRACCRSVGTKRRKPARGVIFIDNSPTKL